MVLLCWPGRRRSLSEGFVGNDPINQIIIQYFGWIAGALNLQKAVLRNRR
jgi:hypothetical protein